jgi:hypothetical protein
MAQYKEYNNSTVGELGCTYSSLNRVYGGKMADGRVVRQQNYVVPKYCPNGPGPNYPPRYDTLSHGGQNNCGGHFSMKGAYPYASCDSCVTPYPNGQPFVERPCRGYINCKREFQS